MSEDEHVWGGEERNDSHRALDSDLELGEIDPGGVRHGDLDLVEPSEWAAGLKRRRRRALVGAASVVVALLAAVGVNAYRDAQRLPALPYQRWPKAVEAPSVAPIDPASLPVGRPVELTPTYLHNTANGVDLVTPHATVHLWGVDVYGESLLAVPDGLIAFGREANRPQNPRITYLWAGAVPTQIWPTTWGSGTVNAEVSPDGREMLFSRPIDEGFGGPAVLSRVRLDRPDRPQSLVKRVGNLAFSRVMYLSDGRILVASADATATVIDGEDTRTVSLPLSVMDDAYLMPIDGFRDLVIMGRNTTGVLDTDHWQVHEYVTAAQVFANGKRLSLSALREDQLAQVPGRMDPRTGEVTWLPTVKGALIPAAFGSSVEGDGVALIGIYDDPSADGHNLSMKSVVRCYWSTRRCEQAPDPLRILISGGISDDDSGLPEYVMMSPWR